MILSNLYMIIVRCHMQSHHYHIIQIAYAISLLSQYIIIILFVTTYVLSLLSGQVAINNWKPLPFERISDGPLATVGEVLGELTTVVTLRIQLVRPRPTPLQDIKDKLLRLLLVQSRPMLMSMGCPLDEVRKTHY